MEDNNLQKYADLEADYFSNGTPWTYEWKFEGDPCCLDWDYETKKYEYWRNYKLLGTFPDVYSALDGVLLGTKTLRQMLLETDFNFLTIL